jgi:hypothetical protein
MNDLVERRCEVITTDNAIVYNPHGYTDFTQGEFHPRVCGKPAYDFVDYGDSRVYMCFFHWSSATVGIRDVTEIEGNREIGWRCPPGPSSEDS